MIGNARKAAPLHLIKNNSILLLSETYGGVPYNLVVELSGAFPCVMNFGMRSVCRHEIASVSNAVPHVGARARRFPSSGARAVAN
jgi:hypothetical protein